MAELDKVPQKQTVEIESVKLEDSVLKEILGYNDEIATLVSRFGEIYLRKKDLNAELESLDRMTENFEDEFKVKNAQLKEILDSLEDKYPQGRINLQEGIITYQPGAPSRTQMQQQSQQVTSAPSGMKVVKE